MELAVHKTRIVATIGPASDDGELQEMMIRAGLNVARLNFSHGTFEEHAQRIRSLRAAAKAAGRELTIMADLPGPKMRIGRLAKEPIELTAGKPFALVGEETVGDDTRASTSFPGLPRVVRPGDHLYLNDGIIELEVDRVEGADVHCQIQVGGELRSRKGLNLPGIDLGISAFTERDRECLQFALENDVDAVSQSFVESAADIEAVRAAARSLGKQPFIVAKIERSRALDHMEAIIAAADGIMVARGDLGVEVPIERIAILQKAIIRQAMRAGKPVITATQMLESMTQSRQPTRAEATDVANAILDGTDCVMLSGESANGRFPLEAVRTLGRIAAATESHRPRVDVWERLKKITPDLDLSIPELFSLSVETLLTGCRPAVVVVPTRSGTTARSIGRFRLPVWIAAPTHSQSVCRGLLFSYGVHPILVGEGDTDWAEFVRRFVRDHGLSGSAALLVRGPSPRNPKANHSLEMVDLQSAE